MVLSSCRAPAIIIVDVTHHPEEVTASEDWLAKWTACLTVRSDNQGCGCCVNIWDMEGTNEAVPALSAQYQGGQRLGAARSPQA